MVINIPICKNIKHIDIHTTDNIPKSIILFSSLILSSLSMLSLEASQGADQDYLLE